MNAEALCAVFLLKVRRSFGVVVSMDAEFPVCTCDEA